MTKIIISLFGRQMDYGYVNHQKSGRRVISPSIALAQHPKTAHASHYFLLYQASDENRSDSNNQPDGQRQVAEQKTPNYHKQAASLVPDIKAAMMNNGYLNPDSSTPREDSDCVTCVPANFEKDGVWDLATTVSTISESLNSSVAGFFRKHPSVRQNVAFYVNLINGTAEQRIALALWAFKRSHSKGGKFFFAYLSDADQINGLRRIEQINVFGIDSAQNTFSPLQCKMNTLDRRFRNTLGELDHLLRRIQIGLDDVLLLTGPSGSGKTMLAKMCAKFLQCLHPEIKEENCVHLNMAAISESLFESELFGHVKGAFTGADREKTGIVAQANNGILFLDEIGELPLHLQAKLLTFLDTGEYRKVGSTTVEHSRFLLICGTNRDLEASIPDHFRRDLFERINMWHFTIPSLHERPDDLAPALRRELAIWNDKRGTSLQFKDDAKEKLLTHLRASPLEGNYREFSSIVRRLMTLAKDSTITPEDVDREISARGVPTAGVTQPSLDYDLADLAQLAMALEICKTAKKGREAGELLFASTRSKITAFNGSAYFQKVFRKFGLKVKFKDGRFDTIERC